MSNLGWGNTSVIMVDVLTPIQDIGEPLQEVKLQLQKGVQKSHSGGLPLVNLQTGDFAS